MYKEHPRGTSWPCPWPRGCRWPRPGPPRCHSWLPVGSAPLMTPDWWLCWHGNTANTRGQPINKICEESSSSHRGGKNKLRPAVMVLFESIFENVERMLKWNINWQHLSQYNHNIVNDCKSVKYPVAGGKVSLINIIKFYHFLPPFSLSRSPFSSRKVDYNKALLHLITPTLRPLYKWG